jgi:hypothetical protein
VGQQEGPQQRYTGSCHAAASKGPGSSQQKCKRKQHASSTCTNARQQTPVIGGCPSTSTVEQPCAVFAWPSTDSLSWACTIRLHRCSLNGRYSIVSPGKLCRPSSQAFYLFESRQLD